MRGHSCNSAAERSRWVIVAGGFHRGGGMDKANAALARYLLRCGHEVHVVAHRVDDDFRRLQNCVVHDINRAAGSVLLGSPLLQWAGWRIASRVTAEDPTAHVIVNGGNCAWPDINWVHSVHAAWPRADHGAPLWFKAKNTVFKTVAKRDERTALRRARQVIANSERTRLHVLEHFGVDESRVRTVYPGSDGDCHGASAEERAIARAGLGLPAGGLTVCFVGALSHDNNKGLDLLWRAWCVLSARPGWDVDLVVAGGGGALSFWREQVNRAGHATRVHIIGFTDRVSELLAASDLLVSPVRYEAYGLNVQEALLRGVPVLVSQAAGITERFPPGNTDMILSNAENVSELVGRLEQWRQDVDGWHVQANALGSRLRQHSWDDMARQIADLAEPV